MRLLLLTLTLLLLTSAGAATAQADVDFYYAVYDVGDPVLVDVYVDPVSGDDASAGDSLPAALRTLSEAWNRIPTGAELTTGYRVHLLPGEYTADMIPVYWESRYGTYEHPIIIQGDTDQNFVTLRAPINLFDSRYVYFVGLTLTPGTDAFHCERCDHVLLYDMSIMGADPETYQAQETVKFNQSTHIYIERSRISGGWDNALDFVAVQHGHVIGNRIYNAGDWCFYTKGGSAYIHIERNGFALCGTGGFSAGQGTGFQYMVAPFLHYEAYYIRFINNLVNDTPGAAVGVQGGFNILIANNTFANVGARSHLLDVVYGSRSCDGQADDPTRERCAEYLAAGGWGNTLIADGENYVRIPNRHVYIYNNVFYNPDTPSQYQHFTIFQPYTGESQTGTNVSVPTLADDDLRIAGNVIWNGAADHPLGIEYDAGCAAANPTCNEAQIRRDNEINAAPPLYGATLVTEFPPADIPPFVDDDPAVPALDTDNTVRFDLYGNPRSVPFVGAYLSP
jgi:hypothetical protein